MNDQFQATLEFARGMDSQDELKELKKLYLFPKQKDGGDTIYLCGNSLGLQPKSVRNDIERELQSWELNAVEGHFQDTVWSEKHIEAKELMVPIVGANVREIAILNTLTVNIHFLFISFFRPSSMRTKVLIEGHAFPSDKYAIKSQLRYHGLDEDSNLIQVYPREGENELRTEDILLKIEEHKESLALVFLGGVNYYTGQVFDMAVLTKKCKELGITIGFDLAHAFANIPLKLHDWGVDFATWCTYKYGNSGPGGLSGIFIHEKHLNDDLPRFEGWWGNRMETRFLMKDTFEGDGSAEDWVVSNPPILSLVPVITALKIFKQTSMEALRSKSLKLTSYLDFLIESLNNENIFVTPKSSEWRGAQISIHIKQHGKKLFDYLMSEGVICDWREPDVIRVAPTPMYNSFEEVFKFYLILKEGLEVVK